MMRRNQVSDRLTDRPGHSLVGVLRIPDTRVSPVSAIVRRFLLALLLLAAAVVVVYLDRGGYRDVNGDQLSLLDCIYYATVSLSTTGYGDITPVTDSARLVNVLVITPLRIMFLIVLVGTTLAVLTERSRQAYKIQRWRAKVRDHVVVVGFGTKGRSAVSAVLTEGYKPGQIVVVDTVAVDVLVLGTGDRGHRPGAGVVPVATGDPDERVVPLLDVDLPGAHLVENRLHPVVQVLAQSAGVPGAAVPDLLRPVDGLDRRPVHEVPVETVARVERGDVGHGELFVGNRTADRKPVDVCVPVRVVPDHGGLVRPQHRGGRGGGQPDRGQHHAQQDDQYAA
ncbi:potassium channel family protein [Kibdelosporangium lantanae]|uniref:Potassium channel family protein n=1 Tax=Kibdelosporangium lantanae TaxID=1497396 RepID=A0ABW3M2F9_9PSEU